MRQWLIPAIALVAVGATGIGVGWSINEWTESNAAEVQSEQANSDGPTEAELDAERCTAALEAAGQAASELGFRAVPESITSAVDRYCH